MSPELHPMAPVDAAWFRMGEGRDDPADIVALLRLEGTVDVPALRHVLEERLLDRAPRFRRRVRERGPLLTPGWEDEPGFALDAHLRLEHVREGEDLAAAISRLVSGPLEGDRSPWSVTLLDDGSGNESVLVRLHHCLGDGFALLDLLVSLADERAPAAEGAGEGERARPRQPPHVTAGVARSVGRLLAMPFDPPSVLRGPLSGQRRVAWTPPFPLADVKRVAHARDATVNDLLVDAAASALRRYLEARQGRAERLRAVVPVNLRPRGEAIDRHEGNWFGLAFVDLPTDIGDRDDRASAASRAMEHVKRSKESWVTLAILGAMGRAPRLVDRAIEAVFARKATLVLTNVPGPQRPLALAGAPVESLVFWAPHPCGLGLGISIMSYAGSLQIGVRSDAARVEHPAELARLFTDELTRTLESRPS